MSSKLFRFDTLFLLLIVCLTLSCQNPKDNPDQSQVIQSEASAFDSLLAKDLGADEYGMKTYVMAFLKAGPNRDQDSLERQRLQRAHLDNIGRLAQENKLVLAGPFLDENASIRGIYIFDTNSLDEARGWTSTDPAIQQGSLTMELMLWYGSAALLKVNDIHTSLAKIEI